LEDAKYCSAFSSGLSATSAIAAMLTAGDHVVCCDDVYGGTQRYFRKLGIKNGLETTLVDMTTVANVENAIRPSTKLVWIESPTNPLLKVCDIQALCAVSKKKNPNMICVVDNTFMSPYFQRPLSLGADIVHHSITKYINGHSDVIMGCVMHSNEEFNKHFNFIQLAMGAMANPFDCYLVNRGVKTLHLRMRAVMESGLKVAKFLEGHPAVEKVLYPELPSHPQHALHKKQAKGMSGMLSFYLKGGIEQSRTFLNSLKIFVLAESLGGYESLAELPAVMTHASVPADERRKLGIGDNLIRISVGLEDVDDLIQDLDQALKAAVSK